MEKIALVSENMSSINIAAYRNWFETKSNCDLVSMTYKEIVVQNENFPCGDFILIDSENIIAQYAKTILDLKSKNVNIVWITRNEIVSAEVAQLFCEGGNTMRDRKESLRSLITLADTIKDPLGNVYVVK